MSQWPDCQECAACCFSRGERYLRLDGEDHARLTPAEQERLAVWRGNRCFMRMRDDRCAALATEGGRFTCTIYPRRPRTCRDFERGSPECSAAMHPRAAPGSDAGYPIPGTPPFTVDLGRG